ncbi:L-dopachrome tautomerase-related protein [Bradyrhizobium japonicum]
MQAQTSDDMQRPDGLIVAAETRRMIWNAVAVDGDRVFVAGPRWAGANGPAVALIDGKDGLISYPDASWNAWQPGADVTNTFVNVNAIHRDNHGGLWIIDTGSPSFGGDPLPGAAKAVRIDLATNRVERIYPFGPPAALPGSYIDDIRFHGDHAYFTDAGRAGLIVLDLRNGETRRVFDGAPSVTAPTDRPIVIDGEIVRAPDGFPLRVNSDPLEVSPDGRYLYFGSLHGPWSRVETRLLDDPGVPATELARKVEAWADLPPVGGTAMASDGTLYFTELASDALKKRSPDGTITTIIRDSRLHWCDAPALADGFIWLPVPRIDRVSLFNSGTSRIAWPIRLYRYGLDAQAK